MLPFRAARRLVSLICFTALFPGAIAAEPSARRPREQAPKPVAIPPKIDLNTADVAALEKLPEIGREFSAAFVAARPFRSLDDLVRIPGFGLERIRHLRDKVVISPPKPAAAKPDSMARDAAPEASGPKSP